MKGVGDPDAVLVLSESRGEPLPIQRRLKAGRHRSGQRAKPSEYRLERRRELSDLRDDLARRIERTGGDAALMEIAAKRTS